MKRGDNCPNVCYGEHNAEIHQATLSVHRYLRSRVLASIQHPKTGKLRPPGGGPAGARKRPTPPVVVPRSTYVPARLPVTVERIRELQAAGVPIFQIARTLGCSTDTVYGRLRGAGKGGVA